MSNTSADAPPPANALRDRLLWVGLALLLPAKLWATWRSDDYGVDGAYYLEVARHVRDGEGLVTNVALFHHGYDAFPHPTPIYPIWPLVLGYAGRVVPIDVAATWGTAVLWAIFLIFGFRLVYSVAPRALAELWGMPLFPGVQPIHAGHLFLFVMGMNEHVFRHTTRPYTEGLAFVVLLAALHRIRMFFAQPGALRALEIGAWLGLLVLNRSQLVIVAMGFAVTLVLRALVERRAGRLALLGPAAVGAVAVVTPWALWLRSWAGDVRLSHLLDFQEFAARSDLSKVSVLVKSEGPLATLLDRLRGFGIGFDPYSDWSYAQNFGMLHWSLPIWIGFAAYDAGIFGRLGAGRRTAALRDAAHDGWRWLSDPSRTFVVFLLVYASGWFLSLHLLHKANFAEWNFGLRHAIPAVPLFVAATAALLARGGAARATAWALLAMTTFHLGEGLTAAVQGTHTTTRNRNLTTTALTWLEEQKRTDADLRIAVADPWPQLLGRYASDVGIHWVHSGTTVADFDVFFGPLACDYLLVPTYLRKTWSDRQASFDAQFEPVPSAPEGWIVYRPHQGDDTPPAGTEPAPAAFPDPDEGSAGPSTR